MSVSQHAQHRKPGHRRAVLAGTVASSIGVVVVAAGLTTASAFRSDGACEVQKVEVVAAPEIAPVVTEVAASLENSCRHYSVRAATPDETAEAPPAADVWISDSSMRTARDWPRATSLASSPVVLAVPPSAAHGLGAAPTYDRVSSKFQITASDTATSAAVQAGLGDLVAALSGGPAQRGVLTSLLGSISDRPGGAVLTPEVAAPASYTVVRPLAGSTVMDYPFVAVQPSVEASDLLAALTGDEGRHALAAAGFAPTTTEHLLTEEAAVATSKTLEVLDRPIRTLGVIDVSGSMAEVVPGAGDATRIELARRSIRAGLRLLPEGTVAGLWRFSSNLTPSTDYEEVAPLTELTASTRALVGSAVARLEADPDGGTGLYSSTLAAVRRVRATFDPTRVNSVIVLSDGKDEYAAAHHISLKALLRALRSEADPATPVQVIGIAYGPDSDTGAMRKIAAVTGGTLYTARDPRDLPVIFREAVGSRICGSHLC
jgi:hypothetical protein